MLQTTGLSSTPVNLCRYDAVIHCTLMSHTLLGIHAADSHCSEAWWGLPAGRKSVLGTSPLPGDLTGTCPAECPGWFLIYPRNQRDFHQAQESTHVKGSIMWSALSCCHLFTKGLINAGSVHVERSRPQLHHSRGGEGFPSTTSSCPHRIQRTIN